MYIHFNGKLVNSLEPHVLAGSEAFLYGYGLFETIKVYRGKLYFLNEHWERMQAGCKILGLDLKIELQTLSGYCYELIQANQLKEGGLRITYAKNGSEYYLVITTRATSYSKEVYKKGFKLTFARFQRNPHALLVGIKSNNYLENLLALNEAKQRGFDEAVFCNIYGKVCEGAISNIFFVKDNKVFTPAEDCGLLPGIVRQKILELACMQGIIIETGQFTPEELIGAEEIFITNSLLDIMPVSRIDARELNIQNNNPVTRQLMAGLKKSVSL